MHSPLESLVTLQEEMLSSIRELSASSRTISAESESASACLEDRLANPRRLEIYREMYWLRLEETLADDFGAVREALGSRLFSVLVRDYLVGRPSRSYTLSHLGCSFPSFIWRWSGVPAARRAWVCELARLELAMSEVLDSGSCEVLTRERVAEVPADAWGRVRLVPATSVRLVRFHHTINRSYQSFLNDLPVRPPRRQPTWLILFRRGGRAIRLPASEKAFRLLEELVMGKTLAEAIGGVFPHARSHDLERIFKWLRRWVSEGLFQTVVF